MASARFAISFSRHSNKIVQDDSGIPLAYFDPKQVGTWRLFGRFISGPIDLFQNNITRARPSGTFFGRSNPPPALTSDLVIAGITRESESDRWLNGSDVRSIVIPSGVEESLFSPPGLRFRNIPRDVSTSLDTRENGRTLISKTCETTSKENRPPGQSVGQRGGFIVFGDVAARESRPPVGPYRKRFFAG